jgi:multidrug efflux system outer membrane protein
MPQALRIAAGLTILALAGCAVTADYRPTPVAVPTVWTGAPAGDGSIAQSTVAWWTLFHDAELTSLIERAVSANLDVQLAQTRWREVRNQLRATTASFGPSLNATISAAREKDSANAPAPVLRDRNGTLESSPSEVENLFQAGFDASWELDLFGRQRRLVEGAQASIEMTAFERDAVVLSLLAEVARTYIELRATQRQIAITNESLASLKDDVQLIRSRYLGGMATYAEITRAEVLVRQLAADNAQMASRKERAVNRLCVLLGQWPGALAEELRQATAIPVAPGEVASGLPSDLLRQRPDILRAERRIAVASADVGVATADLYPRFSLNGAAGLASVSAGDFFSSASLLWRIGPTMTWPILRHGQIVHTIAVRNVQMQEALIVYRQTILIALGEADDAIAAVASQKARGAELAAAFDEADQSTILAQARYAGGMTDYRDVLAVAARRFEAQNLLAQSDAALALSQVALIKSLGGGWNAPALNPLKAQADLSAACSLERREEKPCFTSP